MIPKSLLQKKKLSIYPQVTHGLCVVHLINQKTNGIITEKKNCMEKFCKDLRDQAMKIINHEKKEMIPLTDEEK